ncbi:predicted protein [Naegleria gruberi]|uniref:Predicted protein n=1 Tax=Naegleria gruberi TaxID=5762 RepID=D2V5D0_NAEGR|nr:uncharacterized protein NAEGRDRAFT_31182 [Naegleria gruberi]EFC48090.1 predicted protein [Naegleria gruberi]|eukprot:XP_002680834.1 predicted protein [Naegleria gruberi strain NEG-M]
MFSSSFRSYSGNGNNNNNRSSYNSDTTTSINPFNLSDFQKIGIGLVLIGVLANLLGVLLFFDRGFIAIGNISFVFGIVLLIGIRPSINSFILSKNRLKGTICFFIGFLIVIYGHAIIGTLFELYGYYVLFFNFIPTIISYLSNIPVIGSVFAMFNSNSQRLPE